MRSIRTRLRAQTYTSAWNLVCTRHRHAGWLNELTNYEKEGVPDGNAAVDANNGWDLVRGVVCVSVCVCVCLCDTMFRSQTGTRQQEGGDGGVWSSVAPYYLGGVSTLTLSLARSFVRSFTPSGRM